MSGRSTKITNEHSDADPKPNMKTIGVIPLFGGKIPSGTIVVVDREHEGFVDIHVPGGHVVHGLTKDRLMDASEEMF